MKIDTMNIRPLHVVFGPEWPEVDVMRLFDPDIKPRLLYVEERGQRVILSQAINAVVHVLMSYRRRRGVWTLAHMQQRYCHQHVALVGTTGRAYLDKLFDVHDQPSETPKYDYPLTTFSGTVYRDPVTDSYAGNYCTGCKYLAECREIVVERDGFAFCEGVLVSELMGEVQYAE